MLVLEPQTSRNETLFGRALDVLLQRVLSPEQDEDARNLLEAWLTAGSVVASTSVGVPGPLKAAWGKGRHDTALALTREFTFPMLSRWFRFVKGAVEGPPAQRLGTRSAWAKYVASRFWYTDVPRRLAIRTRLDSLFNNDSDANLLAGSSPSALGLVAANSLTPGEAADLVERHNAISRRLVHSRSRMAVIRGGLRLRALHARCSRPRRLRSASAFLPVLGRRNRHAGTPVVRAQERDSVEGVEPVGGAGAGDGPRRRHWHHVSQAGVLSDRPATPPTHVFAGGP